MRCWQGACRGVGRNPGSPKYFASLELETVLGASIPRLEFSWADFWSESPSEFSKMAECNSISDFHPCYISDIHYLCSTFCCRIPKSSSAIMNKVSSVK